MQYPHELENMFLTWMGLELGLAFWYDFEHTLLRARVQVLSKLEL